MRPDTSVLLVGCGKMGEAMLKGWLGQGLSRDKLIVVEPGDAQAQHLSETYSIAVAGSGSDALGQLIGAPDVTVFAVKPQVMDAVVPDYSGLSGQTLFLSIAAGKPVSFFISLLGAGSALVRAMPNTPAAVGAGMTVGFANAEVNSDQKALADQLLRAVGHVGWVDDEDLMDAVTALSGSGPAYLFWMTDCMAQAGIDAGLPEDLAKQLARETVIGAGALMNHDPTDAETLRRNVTSPGGTTAAALEVLMAEDGLKPLMQAAIVAATRRSKELAG